MYNNENPVMKIFRSYQIKQIDEYTIIHEPVSSVDLMERAANQLFKWFISRFDRKHPIFIFAGPGNNGGDGLALARMLFFERYKPEVFFVKLSSQTSGDCESNLKRLENETDVPFRTIAEIGQFPEIREEGIIVDAIFGSGLSRPAEGLAAEIIQKINNCHSTKISIDIPSGLFGEDNSTNNAENIINADFTLSFQFPKLAFMFPENEKFTGEWTILPIGLDNGIIEATDTQYAFLDNSLIKPLLKPRNKFDHKGIFGHGLLIGGSYGKMGAVVLGAKAALRTGIGLITCHIPACGDLILQCSAPEAMVIHDRSEKYVSETGTVDTFSAVGVGPGIGTGPETQNALYDLLLKCKKPLVIDADGLNIISENKKWLEAIPAGTVLTPHPKEFERLAGKSSDSFSRLKNQTEFSARFNCIVVLKGAHTCITAPDGRVWFNNTGNPGMATAGSGDVLTGMILSLLARGYEPLNAALTGVYLHGLAGDVAAGRSDQESLIASDIIREIGAAYNKIRENY
ncbi:MAG: ADP-dependent NAD(P)H-hydrate dehydratase / NAD(P)H-hydrate epimerase [Bacteroidota bacterium]|nr:ADP-dependent NAD(P)H-hydrate dehydratase / NAD(P)H-hydrate epimerase [Bacteroidota bacterium]